MSISSVTSEALQLKLRQLLPSQQGFGTDLSASDTIIPIIDLTASAEGSDVRQDLQTALAFGSQTSTNVNNTTTSILSTTGFHRIFGTISCGTSSSANGQAYIQLGDGATNKIIFNANGFDNSSNQSTSVTPFDFVVFLAAGEDVEVVANAQAFVDVTTRQIADIGGTLVQPSGFTPQ